MTRPAAPATPSARTRGRTASRPRTAAGTLVRAAASLVVAAAVLTGCADAGGPPPVELRLRASGFDPVRLETAAGAEVRFVNDSGRPQRIVSAVLGDGDGVAVPAGAEPVDSGRLVAGAAHARRLDVPGEYVVEAVPADGGTRAVATILVEEAS
ncbi:cupredoxin domain-containing protein [Myceligenerans salitolerans]|uniref:EfeO-type cupredoxin-like domain-containing protein n=1 Tax=Myceligenerans salitolerans TaxID=1230528 RepID=A0ABS3I7P2_9MICO|nr:hypothetical protein [Myceligenerans salitolerans]MBO0609026.1 hypothetical protein [Myceligenerans salitolerans]